MYVEDCRKKRRWVGTTTGAFHPRVATLFSSFFLSRIVTDVSIGLQQCVYIFFTHTVSLCCTRSVIQGLEFGFRGENRCYTNCYQAHPTVLPSGTTKALPLNGMAHSMRPSTENSRLFRNRTKTSRFHFFLSFLLFRVYIARPKKQQENHREMKKSVGENLTENSFLRPAVFPLLHLLWESLNDNFYRNIIAERLIAIITL